MTTIASLTAEINSITQTLAATNDTQLVRLLQARLLEAEKDLKRTLIFMAMPQATRDRHAKKIAARKLGANKTVDSINGLADHELANEQRNADRLQAKLMAKLRKMSGS